ncbi:MAG: MATE family efflux transporter [Woeseia sp.]
MNRIVEMTYNNHLPIPPLWRRMRDFFRDALRDNQADFTSGSINRALGLLAIPMMLEMSMEAIFAVVDIAFVSRLGINAVAVVGITEALVTVLYAIAIGLGMGVTAMVARRIGSGEINDAARVTGQAFWIGVAVSIAIGTLGVTWSADLLQLMGASDDVIKEGGKYTTVLLGGSVTILFLFLLNAALRGAGDAPVALRALVLANGLNIILDPCLIFGLGPFPEAGVTGAAVATTIGRGSGVVYLAWYLLGGKGRLKFELRHLKPVPRLMKRLLRISIGGIGQFLIATSSWIIIMRIVAIYGSAPVAAYTIALRMLEFAILPAWGLGNAAATLVGQNLGARKPHRAERSVWAAARFNGAFLALVGILTLIFAPDIVRLLSDDPEVLRYGTNALRIMGIGYPMYAVGMIIIQALNGAGDTRTPSFLNFVCFWTIQIPLAYWLATGMALGPDGVFWSIVISESLLTVLAVLVFRRGAWRGKRV